MTDPIGIFGYGSLVNAATHRTAVSRTIPAAVRGWHREWRERPGEVEGMPGRLSFLTVRPSERTIRGVVMIVDRADLPALDAREALYERHPVATLLKPDFEPLDLDHDVAIYAARRDLPPEEGGSMLLRSYLDAVCQGYERLFGEEGLAHFLDTTIGWDREIIEDRENPIYPRAVRTTTRERDRFRRAIKRVRTCNRHVSA